MDQIAGKRRSTLRVWKFGRYVTDTASRTERIDCGYRKWTAHSGQCTACATSLLWKFDARSKQCAVWFWYGRGCLCANHTQRWDGEGGFQNSTGSTAQDSQCIRKITEALGGSADEPIMVAFRGTLVHNTHNNRLSRTTKAHCYRFGRCQLE